MTRMPLCLCPGALRHVFAAALVALALPALAAETTATGQWIQLFNGRDLTGWTPKFNHLALGENYNDTFRVEDGILKAKYDKYTGFEDEFGHLFHKEKFSSYRLRVEYRFVDTQTSGGPAWALRNSGVMIHSQPPESMGRDQKFPVSVEVQFLGGDGTKPRPTANVCTPGTHVVMKGALHKQHCTNSDSDTFHGDEWVTVEVEVHGGGTIRHFVNGQQVLEYEKPQYDEKDSDAKKLIAGGDGIIREGYISLQAESSPVEFRKVELLPLAE
jgi:hypothetical protein